MAAWWLFPRTSSSSGRHHSTSSNPGYARSSSSSYSRSGSSHYKRRPRDGYVERLVYKFKHLLRELWYYLRRNPIKVFFFVIMPLISGGALAAFARQFGVKLPGFLSGKGSRDINQSFGGGYYGSKGYGGDEGLGGLGGGLSGIAGMMGGGGSVSTLMGLAKNFL